MKEEESLKILRKVFHPDKWFGITYDIVNYREIDNDILVYVNSPLLLRKELSELGYKPFISIGTTCDPYFGVERQYELTRKCMEVVREFSLPLAVITKHDLILKDLDLIKEINDTKKAWVIFYFTSYDKGLTDAINVVNEAGIKTGVILDSELLSNMEETLLRRLVMDIGKVGVNFLIPMQLLDNSYLKKEVSVIPDIEEKLYEWCEEVGISNKMPMYEDELIVTRQINLFEI